MLLTNVTVAKRSRAVVQQRHLVRPRLVTRHREAAQIAKAGTLGWEHINLTGDYLWKSSAKVGAGKFRPLRPMPPA
uniref:hypothetical protein n=1 Tax=Polaromonas sp. H6N TaxID=1840293 RepID=UPI0015E8133F|nr:hypothetical protein [Polaromonas sp. H6N]